MTQEEKAKAYEMALKRAKDCLADGTITSTAKKYIEAIFPELRESEGERVLKIIKETLKSYNSGVISGSLSAKDYADCLAWLEKQGESDETKAKTFLINKGYPIDANGIFPTYEEMYNIIKEGLEKQGEFADKVEPKFHKGEWILNNVCLPVQIDSIKDGMYFFTDGDALSVSFVDETYHLWTIEDAIGGDVLVRNHDILSICIFSHFDGIDNKFSSFLCYCGLEGEGLEQEFSFNGYHDNSKNYVPATKEQRDLLFQKIKEAGYEWDAKNKKLAKIEQKPAEWSEEDEAALGDALWAIEQAVTIAKDENDMGNLWYAEKWLKSIKDRVKQQPKQEWSEEDERLRTSCIKHIEEELEEIRNDKYGHSEIISDLKESCRERINWLKSLKQRVQPPIWKPTDEQMADLWNMVCECRPADQQLLQDIYYGLKQLKEE